MSGYRRVNFYELCRLCTSSEGDKIHIFRDEGRRRQLPTKIQSCLPLQILEDDSLPKTVCNLCVDKIEEFSSFRQSSVNAEAMLETYFTSLRCSDEYRRSEGKVSNVYVKETNLEQSQEDLQDQQPQHPPQPHQHQSSSKSASLSKATDSVIQVLKTEHTTHHESSIHQTSVVTSVAAASSRPLINFVDNHNGTKTLTLPLNVSQQSPIKLTQGNTIVMPVSMEGLQSLVQAGASVQIVQQSDSDGTTRLQSYRYVQIPNAQEGATTVALVPSNDPRIHFVDQSQHEEDQHEEITVHPHETEEDEEVDQEMQYVQFSGYNKDHRDERTSMSNISEFLKIKSDQEQSSSPPSSQQQQQDSQSSLPVESVAMCGNCGRMLMSSEEMTEHMSTCTTSVQSGVLVASNNQDVKDSGGEGGGGDSNNAPLNYPCDLCSKAFRRKEHLFQHKKLHTGERPFICGTCGKAFSRKEHLLRHGTSHTGQKMHPCDICSKMFSRKDNLHKHRKTHGICGPYVCQYCGKSFVVKHYYMMHVANHNCPESKEAAVAAGGDGTSPGPPFQFRCDICLKTFVSAEFLKNHKSRHRNRKNVQVIQMARPNGADENQRHGGPQQGEQAVRHIRASREDAVIIEPQETHTLVLKQEIDIVDSEEPQDDGDPLSVEPKLPHHTLSSLIPTTMGAQVIQLPPSYMHATADGHIESGDGLLEIVNHPTSRKPTGS